MNLPVYIRLIRTLVALTVLGLPTAWAQIADRDPLPELKGAASPQESLDWLSQAIFTYAAIAVNDDSKGLSFFKGFSTVKAERCTLTLKNEGKFTQTQEPYSYDAVLPVADLKSSSSKLFQYVTDFPNINKAYGTWNLRLSTKSGRNTMYMNSNNPKPGDFRGHLVTSNSKIKRTLSGSRKGYSGSSNFVRVGRDSASCPVRTVSNGKNRTRNQAASHRELGWFRSCVRAGYPRR